MKSRVVGYDLMRFFGIMAIMIAHADPPGWLFQLRNFGTPLLIVTSALTYSSIYKKRVLEAGPFLRKRLKRLILPAWIYLSFFFGVFYLVSLLFAFDFPFSAHNIFGAYSFYEGFQFMWIFKVYIVLALITPFSIHLEKKVSSSSIYFISIILLYGAYELLFHFTKLYLSGNLRSIIDATFLTILPYTLLFIYGVKLGELSTKTMLCIASVFLLVFLLMAYYHYTINGSFVQTQHYKFPPTLYYLSYSLIAIHILLPLCIYISKFANPKLIVWLSSKSLWIYLWHIMAYFIWNFKIGSANGNLHLSLLCAMFLFCFSLSATYVQSLLVNKYLVNSKSQLGGKLAFLLN